MKILYITSLSGKRINGFMRSAIVAANKLGAEFTMACNMDNADTSLYEEDCNTYGIKMVHIDFNRNPIHKKNLLAKKQLDQLMQQQNFDLVHCNTPIGGLLGRICANKAKMPYVIYQAHGFHFWKGAPIKNWVLYYPVERFLAHYTDLLITINQEDYHRAEEFHLKKNGKLTYIHGVGVDVNKIENTETDLIKMRKELGIGDDRIVFVTVGELIPRKNHAMLIEAFAKASIPNAILLVCGHGQEQEHLQQQIDLLELNNSVKLLGFRSDVIEVLKASDVFVFPSKQEGLPAALMEAMACSLPCVATRIRGNVDLLGDNYAYFFDANDVSTCAQKMKEIIPQRLQVGSSCKHSVQPFAFDSIVNCLTQIYKNSFDIS